MSLTLRVAARFQRLSDSPSGARQHANRLTKPINAPSGIDQSIVQENGSTMKTQDDQVDPDHRDIRPKDVFNLTPNHAGVLNLAQTGHGLEQALGSKVPRDKGYDTVKNLSQYLIRTEGGGGTPSIGE